MTEGAPAILGRCAFATVRGLTVHGSGALAGLAGFPQAVEFRGRGGDDHALPAAKEQVVFRRVVRYQDGADPEPGGRLDLIGTLVRRLDASRRAGYAGACVAVAHRNLEAYATALDEAQGLIRQVDEVLAEGSAARWLREADSGRGAGRRRFGFEGRGPGRVLWLHRSTAAEADPELVPEALRQLAWLDEHALTGVLIFPAVRPGSRAVDSGLIAGCRRAKQQEIEGVEAGFRAEFERRLAEIEYEYQAAARAPAPPGPRGGD
ncbi:hypothetical protein [Halorhodospira halophila]|uniref:Uncharacterized protein n=1 Tax=Halorhodospira halophila (strain DSM 244 / SL1) TaxID=349124 RepID=A1WXS1_HALHL|nr:hypothetical protein [Halorhodospira halophila]ABM62483.1 hypothetical protein Hhal_1719 [Halorhodospira halophila SL1]MBK1728162.1 hypothetical protein [Halorhodospira halophila]